MKNRVQIINQIVTNAFQSIYLTFVNLFTRKQYRHKKDDSYYEDNTVYDFKHGGRDEEANVEELNDYSDRMPLV
jgi:hypothetical protein